MSPEQARGKTVDKRTDIWAFGCCLYEALTARTPFPGETVTDILAAVVKNEPNWKTLPAGTPPNVNALLRRCLRKGAARRLHDVADARVDLEDAFSTLVFRWRSCCHPRRRCYRGSSLLPCPVEVGAHTPHAVFH
jgi:serine/threonine protein kinase